MKNEQIYIISDVHGCYKTLLALIEQFPNKQNSKIVFVGDLVDKGNNSYEVIEFIMNNNYDCVIGNHDCYFVECCFDWAMFGWGQQTLKSYLSSEEMERHKNFLLKLPLYLEYKNYKTKDNRYLVVSHCAISNFWDKRFVDSEKVNFFYNVTYNETERFDNKNIFNVYGSNSNEEIIISEYDASLIWSNLQLCALEFPSMEIYTQENIE